MRGRGNDTHASATSHIAVRRSRCRTDLSGFATLRVVAVEGSLIGHRVSEQPVDSRPSYM